MSANTVGLRGGKAPSFCLDLPGNGHFLEKVDKIFPGTPNPQYPFVLCFLT